MKVLRVISDVDEDIYITGDTEKLESIYNKHEELVKNINIELDRLRDKYRFFHFELQLVDCLTAEKDSLEEIIK